MRFIFCGLFFAFALGMLLGVGVVDPSDGGIRIAYSLIFSLMGLLVLIHGRDAS